MNSATSGVSSPNNCLARRKVPMLLMRRIMFAGICLSLVQLGWAELPQPGDIVFGLSDADPGLTIELVRGPANGVGAVVPDIWNDDPFLQSMEFDNFGGVRHNVRGNLLGVNFGASATGGSIFSFSTTDATATAGQFIGDTTGLDNGASVSRLGSLSVSPDNSKVAVMAYDRGSVLVYDYTAGDTAGAGGALANMRESALNILFLGDTQGTAWMNDNTILAFGSDGFLFEVDATTMSESFVANLATNSVGSPFTSLAYNPEISPYVYAAHSNFDGSTTNTLFVLDPTSSYSVVNQIDLSTSANTMREIALDADGNLFFSSFGGEISVLTDVVSDPASIADNSSVSWYTSSVSASFSGFALGLGDAPPEVDCDFNGDGSCNDADINLLTAEIAGGSNDGAFDLTGDGSVNGDDLSAWLSDAGERNLGAGLAYLPGDANLDGVVDVSDFNAWNSAKFSNNTNWTDGNFDASNVIDVSDFNIWNGNKFQSSSPSAVPEPVLAGWLLAALGLAVVRRR